MGEPRRLISSVRGSLGIARRTREVVGYFFAKFARKHRVEICMCGGGKLGLRRHCGG